jgi:tetraacyldisaccharide 4'-kinase
LREYNSKAPIYHARVKPVSWHCASEQWPADKLPFKKVAAFCGLASPATFWRTLARLGYQPVFQFEFGDHHTYRPMELQRLLSQAREMGAEALLTTEKDFMNLPEEPDQIVAPLSLCWLRIGVEVVEADALLSQALRASLRHGL